MNNETENPIGVLENLEKYGAAGSSQIGASIPGVGAVGDAEPSPNDARAEPRIEITPITPGTSEPGL